MIVELLVLEVGEIICGLQRRIRTGDNHVLEHGELECAHSANVAHKVLPNLLQQVEGFPRWRGVIRLILVWLQSGTQAGETCPLLDLVDDVCLLRLQCKLLEFLPQASGFPGHLLLDVVLRPAQGLRGELLNC